MELCEPHRVKLSFWCKTCNRPACGECLFEDHPTHSHSVVKATTYVEETKVSVNDIADKFMNALDFRERWYFQQVFQFIKGINDAIRTVSVLRRDVDDARELYKGVKLVEGFGPTTALSEASKCLGLKWNLEDCQLSFGSSSPVGGGGGKKEEKAAEEKEKDESEAKEEEEEEVKKVKNEKKKKAVREKSEASEDIEEVKEKVVEEKDDDESEVKEEEVKKINEKNTDETREKVEKKVDEEEVQKVEKKVNEKEVKQGEKTEGPDEKEKCNGEKEKEVNEKEKDVDEEETMTEEEKRKRRKLLKFREKMAAATAAAEKEQQVKETKKEKADLKKGDKEKTSEVKRKVSFDLSPKETPPTLAELKTRNLMRKYAPVPREPSVTPERETVKTEKTAATPQKADKGTQTTDLIPNREEKLKDDCECKMNGDCRNDIEGKKDETDGKKKNSEDDPVTSEKGETKDASKKTSEAPPPQIPSSEVETKGEVKPKNKLEPLPSSPSLPSKRHRGRLARQALKRSQTVNFVPQTIEDDDEEDDPLQSDNLKGLDLETSCCKTAKTEEPAIDNKDLEAQASCGAKEENRTKEDADKKEDRGASREEQEGTTTKKKKSKNQDGFFEMEPEEKERITTELLEVPSLTMVVEGIGGRQAYLAWEKEGLHVYCHQYQDLPYDMLVKSTVLHALIPTKNPTVFLDVGSEQKQLGRVYISLWGHLRRATNFLHLCLGDRGPSFRNTMFLEVLNADCPGERIKGGDYDYNNGRGGEALVDDLEFQEGYAMPMEAGMVVAGGNNRRDMDSQFFICTEDDPDRKFACPFGRVTSGLCYMKEAVWLVVTKEMWIRDCGVLLDVPKI